MLPPANRPLVRFLLRFVLAALVLGVIVGPFQVAFGDDTPAATPAATPTATPGTDTDDGQAISYQDWPNHDWRSPGFVGIVDGEMFDPDCWRMQAVGANVPNLIYRESAQNFNPLMAMAARFTVAEVEELVEPGDLDPAQIHTPGVYVHRILQLTEEQNEKSIERRTTRPREPEPDTYSPAGSTDADSTGGAA